MDFSKEQIVSKSFSKKWTGGWNEFEVRDFLHVLAEQIRHLKQENLLLKKDLQDRENLIKDYRDREHILKESIANAENWAQKIKQSAESHRQLVLEKAQNDSENLIESARQSLQTVYNDIADLKRLHLQFKTGLKAALQVQLDLLENDSILNPALLTTTNINNTLGSESHSNQAIESQLTEPQSEKASQPENLSNSTKSQRTAEGLSPTENLPPKENSSHPSSIPPESPIEASEISSLRESLNSLNKSFS